MLFFIMEIKMTNKKQLIIILFIFYIKLIIANSLITNNIKVNEIKTRITLLIFLLSLIKKISNKSKII